MTEEILYSTGECFLGALLVATSGRGVCAILLRDDTAGLTRELRRQFAQARLRDGGVEGSALLAKVAAFLAAPATGLDVPLDMRGNAFEQRVWQALMEIPVGTTQTYTDVAMRIGAPRSAKEVGEACAANPLAVAVPCHRVIRKDGGRAGYRWGLRRKRALLERESDSDRLAAHR